MKVARRRTQVSWFTSMWYTAATLLGGAITIPCFVPMLRLASAGVRSCPRRRTWLRRIGAILRGSGPSGEAVMAMLFSVGLSWISRVMRHLCALSVSIMGASLPLPSFGAFSLRKALLPNTPRPIRRSIMVLLSGPIGLPGTCVGQLCFSPELILGGGVSAFLTIACQL